MQSQVPLAELPANAVATRSFTPPLEAPLTERQMAELREAWLAHQVNPLGDDEKNGVPYSALND
jgi:hypothetical protein